MDAPQTPEEERIFAMLADLILSLIETQSLMTHDGVTSLSVMLHERARELLEEMAEPRTRPTPRRPRVNLPVVKRRL